jgi:hypothetical protein
MLKPKAPKDSASCVRSIPEYSKLGAKKRMSLERESRHLARTDPITMLESVVFGIIFSLLAINVLAMFWSDFPKSFSNAFIVWFSATALAREFLATKKMWRYIKMRQGVLYVAGRKQGKQGTGTNK